MTVLDYEGITQAKHWVTYTPLITLYCILCSESVTSLSFFFRPSDTGGGVVRSCLLKSAEVSFGHQVQVDSTNPEKRKPFICLLIFHFNFLF